ncbi:MAG: putative oxidoreductase [Oleiphilaceae bacterium]|jgi:putative oxidoreductase
MSDPRQGVITNIAALYLLLTRWVDKSQVVLLVLFRLYMAKIFFLAGLTKIKSWDTTLMLFEYEYEVPLIPFDIAAYLSTLAELVFPVLLVLGLAGRFSAGALFILNIVAAISYPDISPGGVNDHYFWGTMLGILVFYGPGKLAVDAWIQKRFFASL